MRIRGSPCRWLAAWSATAVVLASPAPVAGIFEAAAADAAPEHLLISELMTGGGGASDEFVELYNPTSTTLGVEGLELIYVSAGGGTVSRKATWEAGAAPIPPGAHLLVANAAGIFAPIADVLYANGLSADGGSMALRIADSTSAIDAVGWGSAANGWLEGVPAPAPPAGSSLERLPGGLDGSGRDTDDNLLDFSIRSDPDPQNGASPPVAVPNPTSSTDQSVEPSAEPSRSATPTPSATLTPSPALTPAATPAPALSPTPTSTPVLAVAETRGLAEGTAVTIVATAITGSSFTEGGGYVADPTGGIAVLVDAGSYGRGALLRVTGELDERYHQLTIRAAPEGIVVVGQGEEPPARAASTGAIGEDDEGWLVALSGRLVGSPTPLSAGLAFELDDGSGSARVVVGAATGIDTRGWVAGASLALVGVVGQRDSTGAGTAGYRVQPRDAIDIIGLTAPLTPTPTPIGAPSPSPSPTGAPIGSPPLVAIESARQAQTGTPVRIRGTVTFETGLIDETTAIVQDPSGAIMVRLSPEAGPLARGELVELSGVRSTRDGMLTIRVQEAPSRLGTRSAPTPSRVATGRVGESLEAQLVVARGAVTSNPIRSSAGNVYFDLDDGGGPLRVFLLSGASIPMGGLVRGAWIEITGVVGQETSGQEPLRGYRLWPRDPLDVRIVTAPVGDRASTATGGGSSLADSAPAHGRPTATPGAASRGGPSRAPRLQPRTTAEAVMSPPTATRPTARGGSSHIPRAAALLGLGLASGAALGVLGWRTGAMGRLARATGLREWRARGGSEDEARRTGDGETLDQTALHLLPPAADMALPRHEAPGHRRD